LDRNGKVVVEPRYDRITLVSAKLAKVERNELFGYIDLSTGRFIWREEGLVPAGSAE
jgi:hypothetical protein